MTTDDKFYGYLWDLIMNRNKLEARIVRLEKLLSNNKVKNEGVFTEIADDPGTREMFDSLVVAVKKALRILQPMIEVAAECDDAIDDFGGDSEAGDTMKQILQGVVNDLTTLGYVADVDYNAEMEDD